MQLPSIGGEGASSAPARDVTLAFGLGKPPLNGGESKPSSSASPEFDKSDINWKHVRAPTKTKLSYFP